MNVLYYLRKFPKLSETFVLNEIYALERRGHNIAVFALDDPDDPIVHHEFEELEVPVEYGEIPGYRDAFHLLSPKTPTPSILDVVSADVPVKHNAANVFWAKRCLDFVDDLPWDLDHVHTHFAVENALACRYVAAYHDVPFTVTTHAYDLYREPVGNYTGELLESADRLVTVSEYNRSYIRERFDPETPIDVVHAGIRPEKFAPTETSEGDRILTVARLHEKKGLRYALEAVAAVAEERPDIEYRIVGSGPLKDDLAGRASNLGIVGNVRFLRNVSDDQLIDEYDRARCFLLPSVVTESGERDGIPVALMEAMAMGAAPVSTRVSGIPELVDHESNGLLTPPRDPEATAAAVSRLLENDAEWAEYCRRGRETVVEEFDIETEVEKLLSTFRTAGRADRPKPREISAQ